MENKQVVTPYEQERVEIYVVSKEEVSRKERIMFPWRFFKSHEKAEKFVKNYLRNIEELFGPVPELKHSIQIQRVCLNFNLEKGQEPEYQKLDKDFNFWAVITGEKEYLFFGEKKGVPQSYKDKYKCEFVEIEFID